MIITILTKTRAAAAIESFAYDVALPEPEAVEETPAAVETAPAPEAAPANPSPSATAAVGWTNALE